MPNQANSPLPPNFLLLDYKIEKMLSSGGFSIVYLATDNSGQQVAIKEYLPSGIAVRAEGVLVQIDDPDHQAMFRHGLRCFFEEGKALANIRHPNVVRVDNFFRANETVYMVMQYVRGRTLQYHIQNNAAEFTEPFIRRLFSNFLNGLREVHTHRLIHLDIKPANIYINMDGTPVLLDFGAARLGVGDEGRLLKPMYTQGFAAPEQYGGGKQIGPWTDIYSVGATLYSCLTGKSPQPANAREKEDKLIPAKTIGAGRFSREFLDIIDWCMQIDSDQRPQSVFALQKRLVAVHHVVRPKPRAKPTLMSHIRKRLRRG